MTRERETELYEPVKAFLTERGYDVKAEVGAADVVGIKDDSIIVVELKLGFSLVLLHQAVKRQQITDDVYVAVPRWRGRQGWKAFQRNVGLCRRLGLGVIAVDDAGVVTIQAEPGPFVRRRNQARQRKLLDEFVRRDGDPNSGGSANGVVTSYRQEAERCARFLAVVGPSRGAVVANATGVDAATRMMRNNVYGWFDRPERGVYALSDAGTEYVASL